MTINVHIERLILDGLPTTSAQGDAVGVAVEAELARLLALQGLVAHASRAEPRLPSAHIRLAPKGSPHSLGQKIGGAVYQILNQSEQQTVTAATTTQKANTL